MDGEWIIRCSSCAARWPMDARLERGILAKDALEAFVIYRVNAAVFAIEKVSAEKMSDAA